MDFRQTTQTSSSRPAPVNPAPAAPEHKEEKTRKTKGTGGRSWMQALQLVVLVGIAILLLGIALVFTRGNGSESKYVDQSKYQAVFLANGQVYFGNITNLNERYVHLTNIYYLTQTSGTDANASNYSLVKLGCQQIHDPSDEMVINRDQVTFWENLESKGKVVSSINEFKKQNPNGPDCSQVTTQTQASGNSTQSSQNSSTTGTTPSTGTGTNK
jgi:hypothetical protein